MHKTIENWLMQISNIFSNIPKHQVSFVCTDICSALFYIHQLKAGKLLCHNNSITNIVIDISSSCSNNITSSKMAVIEP